MVQDKKKGRNMANYVINNKKYTVITKCADNVHNIDELYDVICKYAISQIN